MTSNQNCNSTIKPFVTSLLFFFFLYSGWSQTPEERASLFKPFDETELKSLSLPAYIVEYDGTSQTMDAITAQPGVMVKHAYQTIPYTAVILEDSSQLKEILAINGVANVFDDRLNKLSLSESHIQTQALIAQANSAGGAGCGIAILDSGIDDRHCMFAGKITHGSACFGTTADFSGIFGFTSESPCPRETASLTDGTLANTYEIFQFFPDHGTHVAGIAAGNACEVFNLNALRQELSPGGVASGAHIIPINVFSRFTGIINGTLSWVSDQIAALEWIFLNREALDVCVVNMSLGGNISNDTHCAGEAREMIIDMLTDVEIAVCIAAGNNGFNDGVSVPACIKSAVAVGATDNDGERAVFSNNKDGLVDLMAPGVAINSAISDFTNINRPTLNFTINNSGTSMATPTVAGAFAILKAEVPQASVADMLGCLQKTGTTVAGVAAKSIKINDALIALRNKYPDSVPTVSEWGLFILGLTLLNLGLILIHQLKQV